MINEIQRLFSEYGDAMYAGEPVTQTAHALQCALQAEQQGVPNALITAALLHDVGHLLHDFGENCANDGIDDRHEQLGATWLQKTFDLDVCEPVKLHVPAKRYRCAVDHEYRSRLSAASTRSLQLQGGAMNDDEVALFRENPWFQQALQLRDWDDAAKLSDLKTPPLSYFLKHVERSLR